MTKPKKSILVAVSGGVDSTASLFLLKKKGYEVGALFLRMLDGCERQLLQAEKSANQLGAAFHIRDIGRHFRQEILDYSVRTYAAGLTPNPCITCNKQIKFRFLLKTADELGYRYAATGHYARIKPQRSDHGCGYRLFKALDQEKDQSYFLYRLGQTELSRLIFPIGDKIKSELKKILDENSITYLRDESQDVCFLIKDGKKIDLSEFLKENLVLEPGDIKTLEGKILGRHQGLPAYTIGQRKGLEIGGTGPYYVSGFDYKKNVLIVASGLAKDSLFEKEIFIDKTAWVSGNAPQLPFRCRASVRYRQSPELCLVSKGPKDLLRVEFDSPQRSSAPGQSLVMYNRSEVMGGGVITSRP